MGNESGRQREVDRQLSSEYRALATESAPESLDAAIIGRARKSAGVKVARAWRDAWYKPVTFVATLGLSLALIIQLSNSGRLLPPGVGEETLEDVAPVPESAFQEAADSGSLLPAEEPCTDEQRADSGSWWLCIQDLEKQGLTQAAERELRALLEAFPQFSAPR